MHTLSEIVTVLVVAVAGVQSGTGGTPAPEEYEGSGVNWLEMIQGLIGWAEPYLAMIGLMVILLAPLTIWLLWADAKERKDIETAGRTRRSTDKSGVRDWNGKR